MATLMLLQGAASVQAAPLPLGETKTPLTGPGMHVLPHDTKPVLHANTHWLPWQVSEAFFTAVLQMCPQVPQLLVSVIVLAHSVGPTTGHAVNPALQSNVHAPLAHAACPAPLVGPAHILLHVPQLFASSCSLTHAVGAAGGGGQPVKSALQANVQALFAQVGCALATAVVHALPHASQSLALLVVSTQVLPHKTGVWVGQPVTQAPPAHSGSLAEHALVHEPQALGVVIFVSQPSSGCPLQSAQPTAHAEGGKVQAPPAVQEVAPATCARFVQSWPQVPQLCTSLGTQVPPHWMSPPGQPGAAPSPASRPASSPASSLPPPSPASVVAVASGILASGAGPSVAASPGPLPTTTEVDASGPSLPASGA
jgi:hypothetical protein